MTGIAPTELAKAAWAKFLYAFGVPALLRNVTDGVTIN